MENKIEGGPACEWCKGEGEVLEFGPNELNFMGPCPKCEGTGRKPLSEWTDAQKAEWLKENNPTKGCLVITPSDTSWMVIYDDMLGNPPEPCYAPDGDDAWGEAEDFSAALTAAVIAVGESNA